VNTDDLVQAYLALRMERDSLKRDYEMKDEDVKSQMALLEQELLKICNDTNATSIKTNKGTVIRKLNERFFCSDWDNFRDFIVDNQAVDLLERRIHQGNFKEFMSQHEGDGLPPGVNVMREYGVTVRKPASGSVNE
jgi:hypothetical protein